MGKIRLKINGLNLNRLLNTLNAKNISIYDLKRNGYDKLELSVDSYNFKETKKHLLANGLDFDMTGGSGLLYILKTYWYRLGLVVGFIFSILAIAVSTNYYWNINIEVDTGNAEIAKEVNQFLTNQGIVVGGRIKDIQTRTIERAIIETIEDSALVVVTREGVNLNVFIKESTKQANLSENGIVASFSGVIEQIKLSSGNLLVNIGDAVVEGQTLIQSGKVGDVFMEAHGSIIARVQIDGDSVGGLEKVSMGKTGKVTEVSYIEVLGKKFYLSELNESGAEKQYEHYEVEREEIVLSQNNLLPIKKNVLRYYEIQENCVTIDYEQLIKELSESAYNVAISRLPEGAEVLAVSYKTIQEGTLYKVVCSIETKIDIAKRAEYNGEE